jgi:hypothetical protein
MNHLTPPARTTYLLSAALFVIAIFPPILSVTWDLAAFRHVLEPSIPVPEPWAANDFPMIWSAAHLAMSHHPAQIYQIARLHAFETVHLPGGFNSDPWIYPPPSLLLAMSIGRTGLAASVMLWLVGLTIASGAILRAARLPWLVIAAILLSPAALFATFIGQLSVLVAALFTVTLMRADSTPGRAGFCAALTMIKPQMALLGPVVLLARRRWRGVAVGALTAAVLLALTTVILGPRIWAADFRYGAPMSRKILLAPLPGFDGQG